MVKGISSNWLYPQKTMATPLDTPPKEKRRRMHTVMEGRGITDGVGAEEARLAGGIAQDVNELAGELSYEDWLKRERAFHDGRWATNRFYNTVPPDVVYIALDKN